MADCYIGRKTCGCVVFFTRIEPQWLGDTATDVADAIRRGLTIESVSWEYMTANIGRCKHQPEQASLPLSKEPHDGRTTSEE